MHFALKRSHSCASQNQPFSPQAGKLRGPGDTATGTPGLCPFWLQTKPVSLSLLLQTKPVFPPPLTPRLSFLIRVSKALVHLLSCNIPTCGYLARSLRRTDPFSPKLRAFGGATVSCFFMLILGLSHSYVLFKK